MRLYSDFPARRARQVAGDAIALVVLVLGVVAAVAVHGAVDSLRSAGDSLVGAGGGIASTMGDIGRRLAGVPLIGGGIRAPFDGAAGAGTRLRDAGTAWQAGVDRVAVLAALLTVLSVLALVVAAWIAPRLIAARRAALAARAAGDVDLLALRALLTRDARVLARVPDAADGWRRADPAVLSRLAAIELAAAGVRTAPVAPGASA